MGKNKGAEPKKKAPISIENRKARHNYHIEETLEVGISLVGSEVKSIRAGKVTLGEAFVRILQSEAWLIGCHINPYENQNTFTEIVPDRQRKLLLHKKQIEKLESVVSRQGYTIVPLKLYFVRGRVKLLIGLGKGKKEYDKRETVKQREADREMARINKG
jgi:SsrA-binding protein